MDYVTNGLSDYQMNKLGLVLFQLTIMITKSFINENPNLSLMVTITVTET